jgi:hypothetical protein
MLSLNSKHVQHVKIYLACNLKANLITLPAVSEEKIFLNSSQSETRIALGGHICWRNGTKWRNFIEPGCVPFKIVSDSPTLHTRWLLFLR